ncbi:MAG: tetratricopeptide repeat protein [Pseudomonadota bacterium]
MTAKQYRDCRGVRFTAIDQNSVDGFDSVIEQIIEYRSTAMKQLKSVLESDPEMPMAWLLQGYMFKLIGSHSVDDRIEKIIDRIDAPKVRLNDRERLHRQALKNWFQGDDVGACTCWRQILKQYPKDLLAIKLLHSSTFWMGDSRQLLDSIGGVWNQWDSSDCGYSHLMGMLSFALEENGRYAEAENYAVRAIHDNPEDLWALHALAHVFEMQSRLQEGAQLFDRPFGIWDDRNPFRGHLWWHAAMFYLDMQDYEKVLEIYDQCISSIESTFYLDVQNTASLLMRLDIRGVDVGDRWQSLADIAETQIGDHVLAFTEMHYAMALASDHRTAGMEKHRESVRLFSTSNGVWAADVMNRVGGTLCEAITRFIQKDYRAFVNKVLPIRYEIAQVGGSHAQRDVFEQMLLHSAIQCGDVGLASLLSGERLLRRPDNPDTRQWVDDISQLTMSAT